MEALRREKEERERELESENNEFKTEVAKLRAEMEAILRELQAIMDSKLGLELEIAAYRKLLEGEENRSEIMFSMKRRCIIALLSQEGAPNSSYDFFSRNIALHRPISRMDRLCHHILYFIRNYSEATE